MKTTPARRPWQSLGAPAHPLLAVLWSLAWLGTVEFWLPIAIVVLAVQLCERKALIDAAGRRDGGVSR